MSTTKRIRGVSVHRSIIIGSTAVLLKPHEQVADHTHRWVVSVRSAVSPPDADKLDPFKQIGGGDDITHFIKKVTFKLHDTYSLPLRTVESAPFDVEASGWGEFPIPIKIFFVPEANEKPLTIIHNLKLHPWPVDAAPLKDAIESGQSNIKTEGLDPSQPPNGGSGAEPQVVLSPVHSWQYEEIVFTEPTEAFYSTLLGHTPLPLPPKNRFPRQLVHRLGGGGNIGEFSSLMEAEEGQRIEDAKRKAEEEIAKMRADLAQYEKDVQQLKQEVHSITTKA